MKDYIIYFLLLISSFLLLFDNNYVRIYNSVFKDFEIFYRGNFNIENSKNLTLIFITSSNCSFSNRKSIPKTIEKIKLLLYEQAKELELGFTTVAVTTDIDIQKGLDHLEKFGYFDELNIGNGWSNLGSLKYIYDDIKGHPSTPQLIVTMREYQALPNGHKIGLFKEYQLVRKIGIDQIELWLKQEASLPSYQPPVPMSD